MADNQSTVSYLLIASRLNPNVPVNNPKHVSSDSSGTTTTNNENIMLSFDVVTEFTNSLQADLSRYPVSQGTSIADHVSLRNRTFSLTGIVSNTPIEAHSGEYLSGFGTGTDRVGAAVQMLTDAWTNKRLLKLYSEHEALENVVITNVRWNTQTAEAVEFQLDLEQVRLAYAKSVMLNVSSSTAKRVGSNKNGGGTTKISADMGAYQTRRDAAQKIADEN